MTADPKDYVTWRAMLAGNEAGRLDKHEGDYQCGFYRHHYGRPVAIWRDTSGTVVGLDGSTGERASDRQLASWWPYLKAVTHEAYEQRVADGHWGDEPAPPPIGDNLPTDPFERAKVEVEALADQLRQATSKPVENEAQATLVGRIAEGLKRLGKDLDDMRVAEKRPHDEAAKAVQAKFAPAIEQVKKLVDEARAHNAAWLLAKRQKAEAEAKEKARLEAEARERLGVLNPPETGRQPTRSSTASGGMTTVRRKVIRITDLAAACTFYARLDPPPQALVDVITTLARRNFSAGVAPDGCVQEEIEEVR